MSDHASSSTATQIAQNSVFERLARAGYIVSGLLHLAIGYLAIRIALGSGGGSADQSGALAALAAKPGGIVALWGAAVAFLVMALWRLVETALGSFDRPEIPGRIRRNCWIGRRPSRWRWSISRSRTRRSGSPGCREVHRGPEFRDQRTPDADRRRHASTRRRRRDHRRGGRLSRLKGPAAPFSTTSKATPATWCDVWAPWATSPKAW